MAKNLKFFFNDNGSPCARGPQSEKLLMTFLETDIQGDDHVCHDLLEDLDAVESGSAEQREFTGNAHTVLMLPDGITIECNVLDDNTDEPEADGPVDKQAGGDNHTADKTAAESDTSTAGQASNDSTTNDNATEYKTSLRHFREIVEDWEAFILDEADDLSDPDNIPV